jgi:Zn-dependent metalloprotease
MKNLIYLFLGLFVTASINAQSRNLFHQASVKKGGDWIKMMPEAKITTYDFFTEFNTDLDLNNRIDFKLISESTDNLGISHHRYRQHYNGIPVEGGTYILHSKNGFVTHSNGKLARHFTNQIKPVVTSEEALATAKNHMNAGQFYWENPGMESLIKKIKKDSNATFSPKAELVYVKTNQVEDINKHKLAWKFEIYASKPDQRKIIFVDAIGGSVLFELDGCHSGSLEGIAETRYSGTQTIVTDSVSPTEYRLIDTTRGNGIMTFDMNTSTEYEFAQDFVDSDNYWNNVNDEMDEAATDAHWGAEIYYDYLLEEHERNSYDGEGAQLVSYVHYYESYFNAFWNGEFATYGDGNGNPLISLDVVAHEFTHALTEYSANLVYESESGALNESFSDIFGTAVEIFALKNDANWDIGTEDFHLRSMSNPKDFGHPSTYHGDNWQFESTDNSGVHTNSGVQNFWFYLLCNGASGTNDNGDSYQVDSLGLEKTMAVVFRNLTEYLTETSNYDDARIGSLQAAEDIYGSCSYEVLQIANAWQAVGLGADTLTPDLQLLKLNTTLVSNCQISGDQSISVDVRLNPTGCSFDLPIGTEIDMIYQVNSTTPVVESIILSESMVQGSSFTYEFSEPIDFSEPKQYTIRFQVRTADDHIISNDFITKSVTNPMVISNDSVLSFDHLDVNDSLYFILGTNAEADINQYSANNSDKGVQMYGSGFNGGNIYFTDSEQDNYTNNTIFTSKMCLCVDLESFEDADLNFDLKQTHSSFYESYYGEDLAHLVAMRVTVNNIQIGPQFHPTTYNSDPFLTQVIDFDNFAGSSFTLCFESINFINNEEDPNESGDNSFLDNVRFTSKGFSNILNSEARLTNIYPNPTSGVFTLNLDKQKRYELKIINNLGQIVKSKIVPETHSSVSVDLSDLDKGAYTLLLKSDTLSIARKVLLK